MYDTVVNLGPVWTLENKVERKLKGKKMRRKKNE